MLVAPDFRIDRDFPPANSHNCEEKWPTDMLLFIPEQSISHHGNDAHVLVLHT